MAVQEEVESVPDEIDWTAENEVQLFHAMRGHKPVGVNKYFQMACIVEKFRTFVNKDVSSKAIWSHLDSMYDMQSLDDIEHMPFPNEEREFDLPEAEFSVMIQDKTSSYTVKPEISDEDSDSKKELALIVNKGAKDVSIKKEGTSKDVKSPIIKKEHKESKDVNKESKESVKEPKKISSKEVKETRRESKDGKDGRREHKKSEGRETPREGKKELVESKEQKGSKQRASIKEKRDEDKDDVALASLTPARKERTKESTDLRSDDVPKRGGKRSTRGVIRTDDAGSNKSSSPITTPTQPPHKRRRT